MLRITRTLACTLAILIVAGAIAPAGANASPLGKLLHLHPGTKTQDARITVHVFNQTGLFREVKVDGHVYTMMPHHGIVITALAGTPVYAASAGFAHREGELLFTVSPATKGATVYIN
jgi:hypothetical protein